jgi:hypothetical protein
MRYWSVSSCVASLFLCCNFAMGAATEIEKPVIDYFTGNPNVRVSGTAILIHRHWTKAVRESDWLSGATFANDATKQAFVARFSPFGGLDLSLKDDRDEYMVYRISFDKQRCREDELPISASDANKFQYSKDIATLFVKSHVDSYAYNGSRTVSLVWDRAPGQEGQRLVSVVQDKIAVPAFWTFGVCDNPVGSKSFLDQIQQGKLALSGFQDHGLIHATIQMPGPFGSLELTFDPAKEDALTESKLTAGKSFQVTTSCDDYFQTPSGQWFPKEYRTENFTQLGGKLVLTNIDEYRAIVESVDFDLPLKSDIFEIHHLGGTLVLDDRFSPPVEAVIPANKDTFDESIEHSPASNATKDGPLRK